MLKIYSLAFCLAFLTTLVHADQLKQEENKSGEVIKLESGKAVMIDSLNVLLTMVRLDPNDYTKKLKKSMVVLNVGTGENNEEIIIGTYSEEARISHHHLFSVISTEQNYATIRVNKFVMTLNAEEISTALKNINLPFKTSLKVGDLSIELKDFFHVNEYGSYFSIKLRVTDGKNIKEYNNGGPFNYLGYYFSLEINDFSQAKLTVRPLRLGDQFQLHIGEKIAFLKEYLSLELLDEIDNQKNQIKYVFKLEKAGKIGEGVIIQSYVRQNDDHIPEGKTPMEARLFNREESILKMKWNAYTLENVLKYDEMNQNTTNNFIMTKQ